MDKEMMLERIETLVATYGAARDRWPADDRAAIEAFLAASPEAQHLVAEAEALDRLLNQASSTATLAQVRRVRERLFAELDAQTGTAGSDASDAGEGATVIPFQIPARVRPAESVKQPLWREAALLAAALMLGVFVGTQNLVDGSRLGLPGFTAAAVESDDISELAFDGESETLLVEDLL
jgi:hypothetical protein